MTNHGAEILITSLLGLIMVVVAVLLLLGKGAFLIAGYNTMPEMEKRKYDVKSLCRFIGKLLLPIGVLAPCVAIGEIYEISWMSGAYIALVVVLVVFALVYCNTGNRFKL